MDAPPTRRRQLPPLIWVLMILLLALLAPEIARRVSYAITLGREEAREEGQVQVARKILEGSPLDALSLAFNTVAKAIGPSVVHINASADEQQGEAAAYGMRSDFTDEGSGVIVDGDGYIVTNNHVVEKARKIQVELSDGRLFMASKIGGDLLTDIAVLKIEADHLIAAPWGDSDKLEVGSPVWAVGNPFGLDRSVSFGIISAKNRRLHEGGRTAGAYEDFLQTDAAVNPGNSGGPLVNAESKIIGINTAIIGQAYQGVSFSIPSNMAKEVYEKIKKQGYVSRGWLGVQPEELPAEQARQLGLLDGKGIRVRFVLPDSPASKADVQPDDIVLEWNGTRVDSPSALTLLVGKTPPNSQAKMLILRQGKKMTLDVFITERVIDGR